MNAGASAALAITMQYASLLFQILLLRGATSDQDALWAGDLMGPDVSVSTPTSVPGAQHAQSDMFQGLSAPAPPLQVSHRLVACVTLCQHHVLWAVAPAPGTWALPHRLCCASGRGYTGQHQQGHFCTPARCHPCDWHILTVLGRL